MTLKRLEMYGFKSFAKKAVFDFTAPVTSIVGPNGSGKSNVVEAIRFVLGEQSTKSMRSKTGADLIFKGSKQIGKMSRASVSITFDNSTRIFSLPSVDDQNLSLDFDEITITREVFSDGTNKYLLNGNEVRLKDVHELIASVNIGSSGHHIISQGEADRLLNSKPAERREMLEESLGLKLYHYRIKEAERKLERTREHVREAESIRRELAPHIKFLKKQVEKIEKAREIEIALERLYTTYLVQEQTVIARKNHELTIQLQTTIDTLTTLDKELLDYEKNTASHALQPLEQKMNDLRGQIRELSRTRDDVGRQIGRVEGMIESATRMIPAKQSVVSIAVSEIETLIRELETGSFDSAADIIARLKSFVADKQGSPAVAVTIDTTEFEQTKQNLEQQIINIDASIIKCESEMRFIESEMDQVREQFRDRERTFYTLSAQKNDLIAQKTILENDIVRLNERSHALVEEYIQAEHMIG